jgi:hypothetical protein
VLLVVCGVSLASAGSGWFVDDQYSSTALNDVCFADE